METTRILIVEDERIVAMEIKDRLERLGHDVIGMVTSGEAAIQMVEQARPGLILMDIRISGDMDGVETAERIRSQFDLPVIYLTAYADEGTVSRARMTEPFGYIIKPFEEQELHTTIQMALYKHKTEKEIKENRRWLATILNGMGDALIATDPGAKITFMNPVAETLTGWKQNDALGRRLQEVFRLIDAETRKPIENPVLRALESGGTVTIEGESLLITRDGTEMPIDDSAAVIVDDQGNKSGAVLIFRDVSERKNAVLALKESEQQYRTTIDSIGDAIHVVDRDLRIILANITLAAWGADLGFETDVVGHTLPEIFPFLPDEVADQYKQVFETGAAMLTQETTELAGSKYITEVRKIPVFDGEEVTKVVTVVRDVTEQRQLEEELRQMAKMQAIGQLAGGVAHDFNNLLTGILAKANMLKLSEPPDRPAHEAAKTIEKAAERAAELTRQLLGFARRGKGQVVPVDLHDAIRETVGLLGRTLDRNIKITLDLRASTSTAMGDPTQIQQVFLNLAINARDAMEDGGQLTFETDLVTHDETYCRTHVDTVPGTYVMVTITDTGCGISGEIQKRVFEPFFTTKEQGRGTGMGLAMVYGIVKNHGGSIRLYSEPGQGSSFRIYFAATDRKPVGLATGRKDELVYGSGRILLIDDEEVLRDVGADLLRNLGYDVVSAPDGSEAVEYYRTHWQEIDIAIIDMIMPEMSGRECFLALKEINPGIKAILSTGYGLTDGVQDTLDEGIQGFVPKPYTAAAIGAKVYEIMNLSAGVPEGAGSRQS